MNSYVYVIRIKETRRYRKINFFIEKYGSIEESRFAFLSLCYWKKRKDEQRGTRCCAIA